jgi:hypothetical protein
LGKLLRALRLASYFAALIGLLLILGVMINNALLFYGIRFLFIGLVGIGATSLIRDRYIEGTEEEEEYLSVLPTPQIKTPYLPPVTIAGLSLTKKEVLLGGIAGLIGELASSFGMAMALDWGSVDSGAGYFFWILTCLGYPLVGVLLGGISGFYTSFFLGRYYDLDMYLGVSIISPLFVGFIVGLLAGIAPYILMGAWGG